MDEACSLLNQPGRVHDKRELAGFIAAHETGASCPALIGFLHDAVMTSEQRKAFATARARAASVSGDTAKVRMNGIYWLMRTSVGWRISEVPLATSK